MKISKTRILLQTRLKIPRFHPNTARPKHVVCGLHPNPYDFDSYLANPYKNLKAPISEKSEKEESRLYDPSGSLLPSLYPFYTTTSFHSPILPISTHFAPDSNHYPVHHRRITLTEPQWLTRKRSLLGRRKSMRSCRRSKLRKPSKWLCRNLRSRQKIKLLR